jgi:transketolase
MALEDLALMRSLPNMVVFQPADEQDTHDFMKWSLQYEGPCYMRLTRQNLPALARKKDATFDAGRWNVVGASSGLQVASDLLDFPIPKGAVVVFASGGLVGPTLQAMAAWTARPWVVVNASWIQPYDVAGLDAVLASQPRLIVSVEDHYKWGGLGTLMAEHLADRGAGISLQRIGVAAFGQSGTPEDNYKHYGFTPEGIRSKIEERLSFV